MEHNSARLGGESVTRRRSTYFAIVVFTIGCANLWPVSASVPELVKISGQSIGVEQCTQPIDDDRQEERSKLRLSFTVTNVSDQLLIIYKVVPGMFDGRLSRTPADLPVRKFQFDERPKFNCAPPYKLDDDAAPTNEFRILQPNESFTYGPADLLFSATTSSLYSDTPRLEGDYTLQLKLATWFWETEKAELLQQRWAPYGRLVYSDVVAEPIAITIPKTSAKTPRCDTVLLK
jgi:hypothetical protein